MAEKVFDLVKGKNNKVNPHIFLKRLAKKGILRDDPRLKDCV